MAILKDIEVTVEVEGSSLHEYDDDESGNGYPASITKYVEAISGKAFSIKVYVSKSYNMTSDALIFYIYLDGKYQSNVLLLKTELRSSYGSWRRIVDGADWMSSSGRQTRPFHFEEIKHSDYLSSHRRQHGLMILGDQSFQMETTDPASTKTAELGTVIVKVFRVNVLGIGQPRVQEDPESIASSSDINEKELKGKSITHRTGFVFREPSHY